MTDLILASTSKYRGELLGRLKIPFKQVNPLCDETPKKHESAIQLALRLAEEKAASLATTYPEHLIIGSDQVATIDQNEFIGKPGNLKAAATQLKHQSGKTIYFYTALCLLNSRSGIYHSDVVTTTVRFKHLTDEMIDRYLAVEDPSQCAGSFKGEGLGISLTEEIRSTDPTSLIGLPLIKLAEFLSYQGISPLS